MRYCITEGDIDMIIHEWLDEWKIPTIPRAVPGQTIEGGALQPKTKHPQVSVPKKPRMGQIKSTQREGGSEQPGTQKGRTETTQPTNEQQNPAKGEQETTTNPITQKPGGTKRPAVQETSARKKSKAQRSPPEYTITEDDGEMVARMV
jgi:hypothetical protein